MSVPAILTPVRVIRVYICETCREQVRPASEPGIVYAVELIRAETMGPTTEYLEGLGSFFHERCFPAESLRWRRKPLPAGIDDGDSEQ